jgi:DNA mismatch repair protein MutS
VEVNRSEGKLENDRFVLDGQIDKKYRYRTDELNSLNRDFTMGGEEILKEEVCIYEELRDKVIAAGDKIMETARTLAELDIIASNALLAKKRGFTRPLLRDSFEFTIENGRHPVVEHKHADVGRSFVYNSCNLGPSKRFALVTGPNMGGKSTFLRQNALIAIMAQCGMYVPADRAVLGLVDAVYTRIGASDDLSRDRSTFMVEMIETSNILNQASPQSLVIMDEVGRGTAAKEGYSLAWGICKYLYSKGCRTLFATHYSDLSKLVTTFPHSQCLMSAARLDADGLYFLHQIFQGVATKSHAIEIAKLAGMPEEVLLAALEIEEPKE